MLDIFLAPKHYVQDEGILAKAGDFLKPFGQRPLVLGDVRVLSIIRPTLEARLSEAGLSPFFVLFGEECDRAEILRLMEIARQNHLDFIVGAGGGKAIDTSRVVAGRMKVPLITIPTSAATCSATSSGAMIYEKGVRLEEVSGKGAELALVDSMIISHAPPRLLASGMADSLSKWYEGKHAYDQIEHPDLATQAAMILSTRLKETIFEFGLEAMRDVERQKNSRAVETIIEANLFLTGAISGCGGSKFRIALAHALFYGMTVLPRAHQNLHGEWVGFGIVVQLCLEKNEEELKVILPFFSRLGLPLTLEQLGLSNLEDPLFGEGLKRICAQGSSAHRMPFPIDEQLVYQGIIEADKRARALRR